MRQRSGDKIEGANELSAKTAMPVPRHISLDLIKGFVAVGRRMSITLAARDLCLTQSAVSKQIQTLEEQVGVKLLSRGYRSISLTEAGQRIFRCANTALQDLYGVIDEVARSGTVRPVTSVGVAALWLLPRLSRLQELHSGIDVRISANNLVVDLHSDGIDLAIRYTTAALIPQGAVRLFGESLAPVAHQSLGLTSLMTPQTLSRLTLLEFDNLRYPSLQWQNWLDAIGWSGARPKSFLRFNQYDQVIYAALAAQGVALGRLDLIRSLLDQGRLVPVAAPHYLAEPERAYWLIQAEERPRQEVRDVVSWILSECQGAASPA